MTLGKIGSTNLMYHGVSELEWLQGDGACGLWIPCDVNVGKFEVEFYRTSLASQYFVQNAFRGSETSNTDVSIGWQRNSDVASRGSATTQHMINQNVYAVYSSWFSSTTAQLTTKFKITLDIPNSTNTFSNGGGGTWTPRTYNSLPFIGLLCRAKSNNVTTNYSTVKICSFKIWESGVLKHDFAPMRKDGVGRFLDRVTDTWWPTAGTGSFILGPDKT